jgi:molybdopterin converting factor small subunit
MPSTNVNPDRISITVRLYSILRHREGRVIDCLFLDVPRGSRPEDVLDELQIDPGLEVILAVNSEIAGLDAELEDGDLVSIIPAVAGG